MCRGARSVWCPQCLLQVVHAHPHPIGLLEFPSRCRGQGLSAGGQLLCQVLSSYFSAGAWVDGSRALASCPGAGVVFPRPHLPSEGLAPE